MVVEVNNYLIPLATLNPFASELPRHSSRVNQAVLYDILSLL